MKHTMINAVTGERHVIELKPREGLTDADVEAFLAGRKKAAQLIDPENCAVIKYYANAVDIYGLFEEHEKYFCMGSEFFVRNLPDGEWVWFGDLPEETYKVLWTNMGGGRLR